MERFVSISCDIFLVMIAILSAALMCFLFVDFIESFVGYFGGVL